MGLFNSFNISASALSAQRLRMDIISQNTAMSILYAQKMVLPTGAKLYCSRRKGSSAFLSVFVRRKQEQIPYRQRSPCFRYC